MLNKWIELLLKGDILSEIDLQILLQKSTDTLMEEPNTIMLHTPITVCGDIHGQFFDLIELFRIGGTDTTYLFLGDYVDRGYNSVETLEYLLCMKLLYPGKIWLLRGNHESRQVTSVYGLYDEICKKYGNPNIWAGIAQIFDLMPIAAIIDNKYFCVHGGISPSLRYLFQIDSIERNHEIPYEGVYSDIIWADPDEKVQEWSQSPRGIGFLFGELPTKKFCYENNMELILRAHQLAVEGFFYSFQSKLVMTVWSAPNYCYRYANN